MYKNLDPVREHGVWREGEPQNLYCKYCNHHITAGVTRLKHHLAGTRKGVKKCEKAPEAVKKSCFDILKEMERKKEKKAALVKSIGRMEDQSNKEFLSLGMKREPESSSQQSRAYSPLDQFVNIQAQQATIENMFEKEQREVVLKKIAHCIYANGLSFNILNNPYWREMIEEVGKFGAGLKQPSPYEIRTRVLKNEVEEIDVIKATHMVAWETYGCTLVVDGLSDRKDKSLINFLVNSTEGTFFYKSIDASTSIKSDDYLFMCLDSMVEEIGEKNVLQVLTDNHSSYVNAGRKLMDVRKSLYWTPCATHCIELMLEDIGKMKIYRETLGEAKKVIQFIYNNCWVLSLMRKYTGGKELPIPAVTCSATSFLTLQRFYSLKQCLRNMFSSEEFLKSNCAKKPNGVKAKETALSSKVFWGRVMFCFTTTLPLVYVLDELDSDVKPSMPFLYEMIDSAKEKIAEACGGIKMRYMPYWNLIDKRWSGMMHRPIHAAAYYLNPKYFYEKNLSKHLKVKKGLYECMARMIPDINERARADVELDSYKEGIGEFGSELAQSTTAFRSPASWWERFGEDTPTLQRFAVRVLSLTTSGSRCEHNWSTFEQLHSKKRCCLEQKRLNSLVYVMYNIKLRERNMRRKAGTMDPISLEVSSDNEWIVEDKEPCSPDDSNWPDGDDGDREYLDVAAINNIGIENEDTEGALAVKKKRVDGSSPTMQKRKGKGKGTAIEDAGIEDYVDPEDANIILEDDDLVVLG